MPDAQGGLADARTAQEAVLLCHHLHAPPARRPPMPASGSPTRGSSAGADRHHQRAARAAPCWCSTSLVGRIADHAADWRQVIVAGARARVASFRSALFFVLEFWGILLVWTLAAIRLAADRPGARRRDHAYDAPQRHRLRPASAPGAPWATWSPSVSPATSSPLSAAASSCRSSSAWRCCAAHWRSACRISAHRRKRRTPAGARSQRRLRRGDEAVVPAAAGRLVDGVRAPTSSSTPSRRCCGRAGARRAHDRPPHRGGRSVARRR